MKKSNFNKVIIFTLSLVIVLSSVVSAKTIKNSTYKMSINHECIDPFPKGDED